MRKGHGHGSTPVRPCVTFRCGEKWDGRHKVAGERKLRDLTFQARRTAALPTVAQAKEPCKRDVKPAEGVTAPPMKISRRSSWIPPDTRSHVARHDGRAPALLSSTEKGSLYRRRRADFTTHCIFSLALASFRSRPPIASDRRHGCQPRHRRCDTGCGPSLLRDAAADPQGDIRRESYPLASIIPIFGRYSEARF